MIRQGVSLLTMCQQPSPILVGQGSTHSKIYYSRRIEDSNKRTATVDKPAAAVRFFIAYVCDKTQP